MNDHDVWESHFYAQYITRLENDETLNQRLEEVLNRNARRTRRRYNMRRYDGPHTTRLRRDTIADDNENRRNARRLRADLVRETVAATTPATDTTLPGYGAAENYISGIYPYFSTPAELVMSDDWDEAYDTARWHTRGH